MAVGDFNGDGTPDVAVANEGSNTVSVLLGNGDGTFQSGKDVPTGPGTYPRGVAIGDVNNDGFPDIFVTCVGQNRLFRNTGKGTFVDATRRSGLAGRQAFSTSAMRSEPGRVINFSLGSLLAAGGAAALAPSPATSAAAAILA